MPAADPDATCRLGDARLGVKQRHIANCAKADPAYGAGVASALGIEIKQVAE
jgi:catalase